MKLLGNKVLIEPIKPPESIIALPQSVKQETMRGKVHYVGTGYVTSAGVSIPSDIKPKDIVVFVNSNYGEHKKVVVDGRDLLIVDEGCVLWIE